METNNNFTFKQNWETDGAIDYSNDKTLKRYKALTYDRETDFKKHSCFFAFGKEQFNAGLRSISPLKEGEKIVHAGMGLYGTVEGLKALLSELNSVSDVIRNECVPQEVYCYEFNNHECMYSGDEEAIKIIIRYWGLEVAKTIKRFSAYVPIEEFRC